MTGRVWASFLVRRIAAAAAVVLVLSFGIFTLLYLAPGAIEQTLLGTKPVTPESIAAIRAQYHLNDPFMVQYVRWLGSVLHGDFGTSIRSGDGVLPSITARLPLTLTLAMYGSLLAVVAGLPLGVLAALRRGKLTDQAVTGGSVAAVSAPPFAVGLLLLFVFAVTFGWFPVYGTGDGVLDTLWHLTLPAIALGLSGMGLIVRFTRAAMVRELDQDYIVFARARGLSQRTVIGYALRNSLVPVLTASGLIITSTLVGTVLVEVTFALPGLGSLMVDSVSFKDVPVVQAVALLLTVLIAAVNLCVDIGYALADPRIALVGAPE
jgi:peptide/nickel transport system permease protein